MKLVPVNDKIVVKQIEEEGEQVTESGIYLPDTPGASGGLFTGEVVAVGEGMYSATGTLIPVVCKVGDTILYSKHNSGQEYELNGEDLVILSQNEVLSILVEEK